jgi:hypothetical protein
METTGNKSNLRLVRIAGESVLREKILPQEELNGNLAGLVALQLKRIVQGMTSEWENDPGSNELREGFRLLADYLECLEKYHGPTVHTETKEER